MTLTESIHTCPHCGRQAAWHDGNTWGSRTPESHVRRCSGASARERAYYRVKGEWPRGDKELKRADRFLAIELANAAR